MITHNQYRFLKAFTSLAKNNKEQGKTNSELVTIEQFCELLEAFPELNPTTPFNNSDSNDQLSGQMLVSYIGVYLGEIGLYNFFAYLPPKKYGINLKGLQAIDEYKFESISKKKLPLAALILSIVALVVSVVFSIITIVNH